MIRRLEPFLVQHKSEIIQLTGINQKNTIGFLNEKGEIALLQFDEKLNPVEKVIEPGFPGYSEGDLELSSDPEQNYIWLRRGKGVYFAESITGKTGHSISMLPGSIIGQIMVADPEQTSFWISYGVRHFAVDEYNLNANKKTKLGFTLKGRLWPFGDGRFLTYSSNFTKTREWAFVDSQFNKLSPPEHNRITKAMNNIPGLELQDNNKGYNLTTKIMIVSTMKPSLDYSLQWDINDHDEEDSVTITPLISFQKPDDIEGLGEVRQFSSDGRWFDMSASHKFNGITSPEERFVYYVNRSFPAGISPPIRLGLAYYNLGGTFMNHDSWGPCYVMQDSSDLRSLKIFKLHDGLKLFSSLV